jgi:hypothetical protein
MEIDRRDLVRYGGTGLLTAAILLILVGTGWALIRGKDPVDTALGNMRRIPLVGMVMSENPGLEGGMRKALEEETSSPTRSGLTRPQSLIADLRREYIVPALRRADDASALAAVAARAALARYLRQADTAACRELALGTLQRPDALDAEGRRLFGAMKQALEAAYQAGKAPGPPRALPSRPELVTLLEQTGFRKADFDRLNTFPTLSSEVGCDVEIKVDSLPPFLPAEKRGPYARYVLTN